MRQFALPLACAAALVWPAATLAHEGLPDVAAVPVGPYVVTVLNDSPTLVTGHNTITVQVEDLPAGSRVALRLDGPAGKTVDVPLGPVWLVDGAGPGHDVAVHGGAGSAVAAPEQGARGPIPAVGRRDAEVSAGGVAMDHAAIGHGGASGVGPGGASAGDQEATGHGAASRHDPGGAPAGDHAAMGHVRGSPGARDPAPATGVGAGGAPEAADSRTDGSVAGKGFLVRGTVWLESAGRWPAHVVVVPPGGVQYVGHTVVEVVDGGPSPAYLAGAGSAIGAFLVFGMIQRRRLAATTGKAR